MLDGEETVQIAWGELCWEGARRQKVQAGTAAPMRVRNQETWLIFTDGAHGGDVPSGSSGRISRPQSPGDTSRRLHSASDVISLLFAHSSHSIHDLEMIPFCFLSPL